LSLSEGTDSPSDADLFEHLLSQRYRAVIAMLEFAHSLVTPEVLQSLSAKWPASKALNGLKDRLERDGTECISGGLNLSTYDRTIDAVQQNSIFEDLMELLMEQPSFDDLTSIGYTKSLWYRWQLHSGHGDEEMEEVWEGRDIEMEATDPFLDFMTGLPMYTEASRYKILHWRPENWLIADKKDLIATEQFLVGRHGEPEVDEYGGTYIRTLYFSATAVAIRFLKQLAPGLRSQLRNHVLEEDHPSVCDTHTHVRGLIRFWQDNSLLRVEYRVNVWQADLIPNSWSPFAATIDSLNDI
jgi:hypothetical protein